MDIKLAIVFFLISAMIAFSYLDDDNVDRMKRQLVRWKRRESGLRRTKI